jgi:hypothetical protein
VKQSVRRRKRLRHSVVRILVRQRGADAFFRLPARIPRRYTRPLTRMDSESQSQPNEPVSDPSPEPPAPGYQPSTGRKLFMFILCLVALIAVWVFYWFASK